ncbi:MAG: ATP-grasp domain-containing protein [Archaeoglobaceae archaeon]
MPEKVLLVGSNVRNVAESAKKAGYDVIAVAKHCDADLEIYCDTVRRFTSLEEAKKIAEELAQAENAKVVLCSGCELLKVKAELLCNDPRDVKEVVDKLRFYRRLEREGIPHPELGDFGERTILKPRIGGGGEDVVFGREEREGFVKQRFVDGLACSVSLIVGGEATPIAANEILVGWSEMHASGFRYSGNVTPLFDAEKVEKIEKLAVEVVSLFNLRGSVGVDFVYADKPYVLEINPRFQGSLDSVEWSCDVNVFAMHVAAFEGRKVERVKPKRFAARAVLFAPEKLKVAANLAGNPFFADVPKAGEVYDRGEPLVSILASGGSREEVISRVRERKNVFLSFCDSAVRSRHRGALKR